MRALGKKRSELQYFSFGNPLKRRKAKRSRNQSSSNSGMTSTSPGGPMHGWAKGIFFMCLMIIWGIMIVPFQSLWTSLPIFNMLLTFGGISSYMQTFATGIVVLLFAMIFSIIWDHDH